MNKSGFLALAAAAAIDVTYTAGRARHPRTGEPVPYELMLDAPAGKVFNSSGCHCDGSLMPWSEDGNTVQITPNWDDLAGFLRHIISAGFSDCDETECDTCGSADERDDGYNGDGS